MTRTLLFAGLLCFAGGAAAASDFVPIPKPVHLEANINGQSGQCLTPPMDFGSQGHQMRSADCLTVGSLQTFAFISQEGGGYRIVNNNTGGCVDVEGLATHAGARVLDWACNGGDNQLWDVRIEEGLLGMAAFIQSRKSGMCLGLQSGLAIQSACNPANLEGPSWWWHDTERTGRYFHLQVQGSGLCMNDDKLPTLRKCDLQAEYEFFANDMLAETFRIHNSERDTCLQRAYNPADPSHTYVTNALCAVSDAGVGVGAGGASGDPFADLNWRLIPSGTQWLIQHVGTGKCLNGKGGFAAGTPLILWDCAPATANMLWSINGI